ncbi:uncharacterized protein Z518_08618 [Rhinocladiella mackenziei CBS 650.93]|uniref:Uncharacterized protein n=1 Tax=Rhinocladiella mackenziei CBS 650.93 TaxID=1442369 RepID=A0A0D2IH96_9EURO|nr:uncharacterized protein Z518_08618 [Rhinocladiella mackenziei CBS 650.93]KIX02676.1 hypothetical protein Z518_08618 [Rhinocladiella mackenziei CBS 650.93]
MVRPPFSLSKSEPKARTSTQPKNKNLSRGLRRAYSSAYSQQFSADKIKETDPYRTKLLWRKVMEQKPPRYSQATPASRLKSQARSEDPTKSIFSTSTFKTGSSRTQIAGAATAHDSDFEDTQLLPRGVEITRGGCWRVGGAHGHFGSETPVDAAKSREFYQSIVQNALAGRADRDIDGSIFLPMDADFITSVYTTYRIMGEEEVLESEFKGYACENLFTGPYRLLGQNVARRLGAVRCLEMSLKPRENYAGCMWHAPPLLSDQPPSKPFGFDIFADCQFWLCDKVLNPNYRRNAGQVVLCKSFGAFCPYFSIEFKAITGDQRVAANQVFAAGLISLFNRYRLKVDAFRHPTLEQLKLVRHYGSTMVKDTWTVWLFEPKITDGGAWAGCTIRMLDNGRCRDELGVMSLLQWINEIHRWGLCEYALGCEEDIKQILNQGPGNLRISAIGISKETETVKETGTVEEV